MSASRSSGSGDGGHESALAMHDDQSGGDLRPFIEQLSRHLPVDAGVMPVAALLQTLRDAAPDVFVQLDRFIAVAREVAGLSEAMALQWKAKGSAQYAAGALSDAMLSYTHGLLCAESDDAVATLLNNRSTVLYAMGHYAAACLDADRALRYKPTYWKAMQRRGRAMQQLGLDRALAQKDMDAAEAQCATAANSRDVMRRVFGDDDDDNDDDASVSTVVLPPRLALPHARLRVDAAPAPADRRVCARVPIASGTTVLCETPYAHVARTEAMLSVCAYCLRPAMCLYHGDDYRRAGRKSRGLFCSVACAAASWRFHGAAEQHSVFFLCCPNDALLAARLMRHARAFAHVTPLDMPDDDDKDSNNSSHNNHDTKQQHDDKDEQAGTLLTCDYFDATFLRTLRASHSRELQPQQHSSNNNNSTTTAAAPLPPPVEVGGSESVVAALALYMHAVDTPDAAEQLRKVQRQLLLHAMPITYTARVSAATAPPPSTSSPQQQQQQQAFGEQHEAYTSVPVRAGKALYAAAALLNHACDANCFVSFVGNPHGCSARLVVRTVRDVCAGEELTIAYGGVTPYELHSTRHRRRVLYARYGFVCHCDACDEPRHRAHAQLPRNVADEPVRTQEAQQHYVQAADLYQKGKRMLREGNYKAALTALTQSYERTMRYVCPPPQPPQAMLPKLHNALALAHYHLRHLDACVTHLREELRLDVAIHGSDNRVELVPAYTRLATLLRDTRAASDERAACAHKAAALLRRFYAPSPQLQLQLAYLRTLARDTNATTSTSTTTTTTEDDK